MKHVELNSNEACEKALKVLEKCKAVTLVTNGTQGGHPNARAMQPARIDALQTIWFITGLDSGKLIELIKDNKAMIYGYASRTNAEFRLWGTVEILEDSASRAHAWQDDFSAFFPAGANDPSMRVLRFTATNGFYSAPNKEGQATGNFSF